MRYAPGALIGAVDAADDMHLSLALRGAGAQVIAHLTNAGLAWPSADNRFLSIELNATTAQVVLA